MNSPCRAASIVALALCVSAALPGFAAGAQTRFRPTSTAGKHCSRASNGWVLCATEGQDSHDDDFVIAAFVKNVGVRDMRVANAYCFTAVARDAAGKLVPAPARLPLCGDDQPETAHPGDGTFLIFPGCEWFTITRLGRYTVTLTSPIPNGPNPLTVPFDVTHLGRGSSCP